jgi:tRNA threonylcarbamoyladenosine biosynthesis protein TsaE
MKPELELAIADLADLPSVAKGILDFAGETKVFLFYAPMGAGKTTLIKEMCIQLNSGDNFSSPTYSIINEYDYPDGKIYHFDLYRLKNQEEVLDLGVEDHLTLGNYCFFEWPELVENLLDMPCLKIEMNVKQNIRYLRCVHTKHA